MGVEFIELKKNERKIINIVELLKVNFKFKEKFVQTFKY